MKIKLSNKNKTYWLNYLGYWLIFIFSCLVFGNIEYYDGGSPVGFDFKFGFMATSIISAFVLAHLIAKKYSKYEQLDEFRIKEGLDYKEFNSKYGRLLEIMDK